MEASLHEDLVAAQRNRLFDLLIERLARQYVGVSVRALAVEGAEITDRRAHVGVVDVSVDVVSAVWLWMESATNGIGSPTQRQEVLAFEQANAFIERQALALNSFAQHALDRRIQLAPLQEPAPIRKPGDSNGAILPSRAVLSQNTKCWPDSAGKN